jgi:hypothetical protein
VKDHPYICLSIVLLFGIIVGMSLAHLENYIALKNRVIALEQEKPLTLEILKGLDLFPRPGDEGLM